MTIPLKNAIIIPQKLLRSERKIRIFSTKIMLYTLIEITITSEGYGYVCCKGCGLKETEKIMLEGIRKVKTVIK